MPPLPSLRRGRASTARHLERQTGALASAAIARMDERYAWYRAMSAEQRSWVGLVAQAGIAAFVEWFREPGRPPAITADVFGTAPLELARAVSLEQTVDMVRVTIEVVEERIDELAAPGDAERLRQAALRYSREVAFATAGVYARAAEARGAWDARLEALVVDGLLRGEADDSLRSRAAALGWGAPSRIVVAAGTAPDADPETVVGAVARAARSSRLDVLAGVQGDRLVVILGGEQDALAGVRRLANQFGPGPVVVGPAVGDLLQATRSARAALSGLAAVRAWPSAPRVVTADELLPERALAGDAEARAMLVEEVYRPLAEAGSDLLPTVVAYLEESASLEATARLLFVHPNTVRYRLKRVAEVCGRSPAERRDAFALQLALVYGRLDERSGTPGEPVGGSGHL